MFKKTMKLDIPPDRFIYVGKKFILSRSKLRKWENGNYLLQKRQNKVYKKINVQNTLHHSNEIKLCQKYYNII